MYFYKILLLVFFSLSGLFLQASDYNLPDMGDTISGISSPKQEEELGQLFLKSFRGQVPSYTDPIVVEYIESLINRLKNNTVLKKKPIDLLIVNSRAINAFAVPGRILGINTGLLIPARNEQELAGVIAHEIAHLSQRHYARQRENARNSLPTQMLGLLAGLAIASAGNTEAGMATVYASQAAAQHQRLRFSREFEQEADRIAFDLLKKNHMNPNALGTMFESLREASRYQTRPPEFLSTHPIHNRRIADIFSRGRQFTKNLTKKNDLYSVIRARVLVDMEANPYQAVNKNKSQLLKNSQDSSVRYALAYAQAKATQYSQAKTTLAPLLKKESSFLPYQLLQAEILSQSKQYHSALKILMPLYSETSQRYSVAMAYAKNLMYSGQANKASRILSRQVRERKNDVYAWLLLADAYGLSQQRFKRHMAKAQYDILRLQIDDADKQLAFAQAFVGKDVSLKAKVEAKKAEIKALKKQIKKFS